MVLVTVVNCNPTGSPFANGNERECWLIRILFAVIEGPKLASPSTVFNEPKLDRLVVRGVKAR